MFRDDVQGWTPWCSGMEMTSHPNVALDWFVFFYSSQVCRAGWVMNNSHLWMCTASSASSLSRKNSHQALRALPSLSKMLFSGQTSDDHSSMTRSPVWLTTGLCLNQRAENKIKRQNDSDCVTGIGTTKGTICYTHRTLHMPLLLNESPLAEAAWTTHERYKAVWRCSAAGITHMWWFLWWAPQNCGSPALRSLSTVRGLGWSPSWTDGFRSLALCRCGLQKTNPRRTAVSLFLGRNGPTCNWISKRIREL